MSALCIIALSFVLGIILGNEFPTPFWAATTGALGTLFVSLILCFCKNRFRSLAFVLLVFALGWGRGTEKRPVEQTHIFPPCERVVEGEVLSPPTLLGEVSRFTLAITGRTECLRGPDVAPPTPASGRLYVTVMETGELPIHMGDRVRLRSKIKPVSISENFGVRSREMRSSEFATTLKTRSEIAMTRDRAHPVTKLMGTVRNRIAVFFCQSLPERHAAVARALTLGESAVLKRDQRDQFRRTGTAHLLSVSGLHLGLLALFTFTVFKIVLVRIPPLTARIDVGRIAAAAAIPFVIGFTVLTGLRTPVTRACVMVVSALTARIIGRNTGTLEALSVAVAALLVVNPAAITHAGFQLSFSAVLGFLLVFGQKRAAPLRDPLSQLIPVSRFLRHLRRARAALIELFRASLTAFATTTPILIYHFGAVSFLGVVVNVIAIPYVSFAVLPLLLVAGPMSLVSPCVAGFLTALARPLLSVLDFFLSAASRLPGHFSIASPATAMALTFLCLAIVLYLLHNRRPVLLALTGAGLLALLGFVLCPPPFPKGALTLDFLDVGQGDATLITFPGGTHWLVDGGSAWSDRSNAGTSIIVPVLRANRVTEIDTLVLTHPDTDHAGGLEAVVDSMVVRRIIDNGQGKQIEDGAYARFIDAAERRETRVVRTPHVCGAHTVEGATVTILSPCPKRSGFYPDRSRNDNSIVLLLTYEKVRVLLTGDIERPTETALVQEEGVGHVDILKLPHHGSATSSSTVFLNATRPRIAIASVGRFNRFGFPSHKVRARLDEGGTVLFRTDTMGGVRIVVDSSGIRAHLATSVTSESSGFLRVR